MIPVIVWNFKRPAIAREAALSHLALTHPGDKMKTAGSLIVDLLLTVLNGNALKAAIYDAIKTQKNPLTGHPYTEWLNDPDDWVIGPRFSTACYVEDSVPAVIYLALKYHDDPQKALIVNTNLGGDNAGRGSVLGSLLGASNDLEKFRRKWIEGLFHPPPEILQNR